MILRLQFDGTVTARPCNQGFGGQCEYHFNKNGPAPCIWQRRAKCDRYVAVKDIRSEPQRATWRQTNFGRVRVTAGEDGRTKAVCIEGCKLANTPLATVDAEDVHAVRMRCKPYAGVVSLERGDTILNCLIETACRNATPSSWRVRSDAYLL